MITSIESIRSKGLAAGTRGQRHVVPSAGLASVRSVGGRRLEGQVGQGAGSGLHGHVLGLDVEWVLLLEGQVGQSAGVLRDGHIWLRFGFRCRRRGAVLTHVEGVGVVSALTVLATMLAVLAFASVLASAAVQVAFTPARARRRATALPPTRTGRREATAAVALANVLALATVAVLPTSQGPEGGSEDDCDLGEGHSVAGILAGLDC